MNSKRINKTMVLQFSGNVLSIVLDFHNFIKKNDKSSNTYIYSIHIYQTKKGSNTLPLEKSGS